MQIKAFIKDFSFFLGNIRGEINTRLAVVNFLSRQLTKGIKRIFDILAIFPICFAKQKLSH